MFGSIAAVLFVYLFCGMVEVLFGFLRLLMAGYFLPLVFAELTFGGRLEDFVGLIGSQTSEDLFEIFENKCEVLFLLCCGF